MQRMTRNTRWGLLVALAACGRSESPPPATPEPEPSTAPTAEHASPPAAGQVDPASVERIPPATARERVQSGQALLVCAYDDTRCAQFQLQGAITYSALRERLPQLAENQEIILYCD